MARPRRVEGNPPLNAPAKSDIMSDVDVSVVDTPAFKDAVAAEVAKLKDSILASLGDAKRQ